MKVLLYLVAAVTIQAYALPYPKVILEGENGITGMLSSRLHSRYHSLHFSNPHIHSPPLNSISVNDDGSTSIDGETGITTNSAGQTTNVGGSSGITIGEPAVASNSTKGTGTAGGINVGSKGNKTSSAGSAKSTGSGGADGLAALIGALEGVSQGNLG
jgi:hypothetical protein